MVETNYFGKVFAKPFPKIQKNGAIAYRVGEPSIFVYKGRLLALENRGPMLNRQGCIVDYFTRELLSEMKGEGDRFLSAFCDEDRIYVFSTLENQVYRYVTEDLKTWTKSLVLEFPDIFRLFNTSVCKGDGKYMMAVEAAWAGLRTGKEKNTGNPYIGVHFTEFFAESTDLEHWTLYPFEDGYTPERYNACPCLRYCNGYYYMICLEELPLTRYAPYMYRTKDFKEWEMGMCNPIFIASEEDRHTKPGYYIDPEVEEKNAHSTNINNSDVDICEFEGKTYINYLTGTQGDTWHGCLCEAIYDGPMAEYLEGNFA